MTLILTLLIGLLLPATEWVTGISVVPNRNRTEIRVSVDGLVSHRAFSLEAPARIVVDLMNARHALSREDFLDINRGGVLSVRTSQYSEDIVRVVVDLEGMTEYTVEASGGAVRCRSRRTWNACPGPWRRCCNGWTTAGRRNRPQGDPRPAHSSAASTALRPAR